VGKSGVKLGEPHVKRQEHRQGVQMSQKPTKTSAELESMIMAELREYPECESAAVAVMGPTSIEVVSP
jgi:hypothetical protein